MGIPDGWHQKPLHPKPSGQKGMDEESYQLFASEG